MSRLRLGTLHLCFATSYYILGCSDHSTAVAGSRHCFDRNTASGLIGSSAVD